MKKIVVTGAGGYIGRHVVSTLLDMKKEVIAVDYKADGIDERAQFYNENILSYNPDLFNKLGRPDVCIHLAWKDGFLHNSKVHMELLSSHHVFIENLLSAGLEHISVMGTMHEIGFWEGEVNEETPCNPLNMYGIAKDALRKSSQLLAAQSNVTWQWLRAFYIYGDDTFNNSVFAKILKAGQEGEKKFPFTTGKALYDFIHIDVLSKQIAFAATQKTVNGIINCCTGVPVTLADRVELFIKENNLEIELEYGAYPDRPYDSAGIWGNNQKINTILK